MLTYRGLLLLIAVTGYTVLGLEFAAAQSYPARPITLVIPFPPGTNSEIAARFLSDELQKTLGQPLIIDHRPGGAAGTVGAKSVAAAAPDGYTLLFSPPGPLAVAPLIYKNLGYEPTRSFVPVASIFASPQMLVVHPSLPVRSMNELIAYAKANPGKVNFGSPGYGTQPHLLSEMLRLKTGVDVVHVPYKGPAQQVTDLLAGHVQMNFETVALLLPHVETGKLKALAIADQSRSPKLPDVPTTAESGFPELRSTFWAGIVAPAGTSQSIVMKLNTAINQVLKLPQLAATLDKINARPMIGSPEEFASFIATETQKWGKIVREANIRVE